MFKLFPFYHQYSSRAILFVFLIVFLINFGFAAIGGHAGCLLFHLLHCLASNYGLKMQMTCSTTVETTDLLRSFVIK